MDFKQLFDDDRAVSPVIGVILMVAITVILAAVIGTFVLGLGDQIGETTPTASFGFDTQNIDGTADTTGADDILTVTHQSGDSIEASNLVVKAGDTTLNPTDDNVEDWSSTPVSAGSQLTLDESGAGSTTLSGETTVRVIYNNPNSDSSSTLATQTFTFDGT